MLLIRGEPASDRITEEHALLRRIRVRFLPAPECSFINERHPLEIRRRTRSQATRYPRIPAAIAEDAQVLRHRAYTDTHVDCGSRMAARRVRVSVDDHVGSRLRGNEISLVANTRLARLT